jgi:HSP20 family molecular chaperone IbpA
MKFNQMWLVSVHRWLSTLHPFPDDASPGKVSADFKDGVLTVRLAKVAKAKPQQVEINVS